MEKVLKEKDVVTLQGDKQFYVLKTLVYNYENYALLTSVGNKNEFQYIIVCEKIIDDELFLDILTDAKTIEPILQKFKN